MKTRVRQIAEGLVLLTVLAWAVLVTVGTTTASATASAASSLQGPCVRSPWLCEDYDGTPCGGACDPAEVCCW